MKDSPNRHRFVAHSGSVKVMASPLYKAPKIEHKLRDQLVRANPRPHDEECRLTFSWGRMVGGTLKTPWFVTCKVNTQWIKPWKMELHFGSGHQRILEFSSVAQVVPLIPKTHSHRKTAITQTSKQLPSQTNIAITRKCKQQHDTAISCNLIHSALSQSI